MWGYVCPYDSPCRKYVLGNKVLKATEHNGAVTPKALQRNLLYNSFMS